jgi:phosphate butyryltransferase
MIGIRSIQDVMKAVKNENPPKLAVAMAADDLVLNTVSAAKQLGLANAVLIGDEKGIKRIAGDLKIDPTPFEIVDINEPAQAAAEAVRLVASGKADILMKGLLETKDFMKAVIDPDAGLRQGDRIISSMLAVELKKENRFLFITDIGFVPLPDLETKKKIIENAVETMHLLGIKEPKVAVVCATESINPKMQATVDARRLEEMNQRNEIQGCVIAGPISLDLAVSQEAARHKGYTHPVAGRADLLVVPSLEVGNVLAKTFDYFTDYVTVSIVMGAKVPIVFTSRATRLELRLNAIAFAVLLAQRKTKAGER